MSASRAGGRPRLSVGVAARGPEPPPRDPEEVCASAPAPLPGIVSSRRSRAPADHACKRFPSASRASVGASSAILAVSMSVWSLRAPGRHSSSAAGGASSPFSSAITAIGVDGGPSAPSMFVFSAVGAVAARSCTSSAGGGPTRAQSAPRPPGQLRASHTGALFLNTICAASGAVSTALSTAVLVRPPS